MNLKNNSILQLITALLLVSAVWLILLPRLSNCPPVKEHIRSMQESEIAVDAMFYSELNWFPGK